MTPNQILKGSKNTISQSLADIFNASLMSSIFPDDLKIARVAPIFKGNLRSRNKLSSIEMVLEISHVKVRNLRKTDVAIL